MWNRRHWGAACVGWWLARGAGLAHAEPVVPGASPPPRLVSTRIVVALDSRLSLCQLPLVLAEVLGFFRAEGLDVELREFGDAEQAWAGLASRAVHVFSGAFSQVLSAAGPGAGPPRSTTDWQSFVVQSRAPHVVLGSSQKTLPGLTDVAELRGRRVGVRGGDPAGHLVLQRLLDRAGLSERDVRLVPQPNAAAAVQAFRNAALDALCYTDPTVTQLEQWGELRVVADTRSLAGTQDVFGGPLPMGCVGAPTAFVTQYPRVTQALTDAVVRSLKWLQTAGPSDLIKSLPESHFQGDRALYLAAFERARAAFSPDGFMPRGGPETALRAVGADWAGAPPAQLAARFTNEFAVRAKARFRA